MWHGYAPWFFGVPSLRSLRVHPGTFITDRRTQSWNAISICRANSAARRGATGCDAARFAPAKAHNPGSLTINPNPLRCRSDACADHHSDATSDTDDCTNCEPDCTSAQCRRRHADVPGLRNAHGSRDRCVPPV